MKLITFIIWTYRVHRQQPPHLPRHRHRSTGTDYGIRDCFAFDLLVEQVDGVERVDEVVSSKAERMLKRKSDEQFPKYPCSCRWVLKVEH
jgi:hypothetical protein